ncbi:response regulator [Arenimonas sp.]|uniref:response regulator n=1 Tax=Arenimonas sp. TaxID=1872635 RepID=UPI0025C183B7|nr:response regulator [Arenimonas sp.]
MDVYERIKRLFGWGSKPVPKAVSRPTAPPPADGSPAPPSPEPGPSGPERREKLRLNARAGTRMLVIDDSATIVALLSRMLRQNGYEVLEAEDAEKGLEIARTQAPELIFLDIVLPGMDGFAALRQLRRDPLTRDVPVIMISGNEQATEQFYVHRIGADDFMKKPFARAEVFARVERLLDAELVPRRLVAAPPAAIDADEGAEPA